MNRRACNRIVHIAQAKRYVRRKNRPRIHHEQAELSRASMNVSADTNK